MRILKRTTAEEDLVEEEFFQPAHGLELEPYLAIEDIAGIHHLGRYHWVKTVLRAAQPKRVLDIACGVGYGTHILAGFLPDAHIMGVDYDPRAIDLARQRYSRDNLQFLCGDMVSWAVMDAEGRRALGDYDAIVSFDTIEHVAHRDIAWLRLASHLHSKGMLALSTPCGQPETDYAPDWVAHHLEYGAVDLRQLLGRFFGQVLTPDDHTLPNIEYWEQVINCGKTRYLNRMNPVICTHPLSG